MCVSTKVRYTQTPPGDEGDLCFRSSPLDGKLLQQDHWAVRLIGNHLHSLSGPACVGQDGRHGQFPRAGAGDPGTLITHRHGFLYCPVPPGPHWPFSPLSSERIPPWRWHLGPLPVECRSRPGRGESKGCMGIKPIHSSALRLFLEQRKTGVSVSPASAFFSFFHH